MTREQTNKKKKWKSKNTKQDRIRFSEIVAPALEDKLYKNSTKQPWLFSTHHMNVAFLFFF